MSAEHEALLARLLGEALPRGNRCVECIWWEPGSDELGACRQGVPSRAMHDGCRAHDGCYEWFSRLPKPAWYDTDYEGDEDDAPAA